MPTPAISCPCGNQFDLPENFESRRVNCPVCNAAIFLTADQLPGAEPQTESQGGYGFALEAEPAEAKQRSRGVEGIPDWLDRYRKNRDVKKADREKMISLLENLGAVPAERS